MWSYLVACNWCWRLTMLSGYALASTSTQYLRASHICWHWDGILCLFVICVLHHQIHCIWPTHLTVSVDPINTSMYLCKLFDRIKQCLWLFGFGLQLQRHSRPPRSRSQRCEYSVCPDRCWSRSRTRRPAMTMVCSAAWCTRRASPRIRRVWPNTGK